ncbi:MAG: TIGR02587 family membrane protein [Thermomicrobiales bacterium]
MTARGPAPIGSWRGEIQDFFRALAGGFIFAVPLLYTMEMWWIGTATPLWKLLAFLGIAFLIGLGLAGSRDGGFKAETSRFASIEQAVDGMAIGIVGAVVILAILNRIQGSDPLGAILGKVIIQAIPLSIGAAVANAVFGRGRNASGRGEEEPAPPLDVKTEFLSDLGATTIGAIFLGFSIAPTDEVTMLAAGMDYPHLLALIVLSLAVSLIIVFASGYGDSATQPGPFQSPLAETVFSYVVSLLVAAFSLYFFDRIEWGDPLGQIVAMVLVLGLPTTIGGAAGRLAV